jgi:hypothetical protein
MEAIDTVSARLDRLERQNLRLKIGLVAAVALTIVGFRSAAGGPVDLIQAHQIQVVDERGVPLVTLAAARNNAGGAIILRDSSGEKRTWWEASTDSARLVLDSPAQQGGDTVAGMAATGSGARASLLGPTGASFEATVQNEMPHISLSAANGKSLFSAPWRK